MHLKKQLSDIISLFLTLQNKTVLDEEIFFIATISQLRGIYLHVRKDINETFLFLIFFPTTKI